MPLSRIVCPDCGASLVKTIQITVEMPLTSRFITKQYLARKEVKILWADHGHMNVYCGSRTCGAGLILNGQTYADFQRGQLNQERDLLLQPSPNQQWPDNGGD